MMRKLLAKPGLLLCGLLLAALGLQLLSGGRQIQHLAANPAFCHADSDLPLLTNLDGFYYLRQAERLAQGVYSAQDPLRFLPGPAWPPPLSLLLHGLSWLLPWLEMQAVALWLPLALGALLALPLALWGSKASGMLGGVSAVFLGLMTPAWQLASGAGRLDTATLPPTLLLLAAFGIARLLEPAKKGSSLRSKLLWGLCLALCLALLGLWWPPGLLLTLFWLPAAGVIALRPVSRNGSRPLAKGVVAGLALLPLIAAGASLLLWPELLHWLKAHLELLTKGAGGAGEVGQGIAELRAPGFVQLLGLTAGSAPGGAAGLVGLVLLFWRRPLLLLALAPLVAAGAAGFWAERFSVFAVPLMALGLCTLVLAPLHLGLFRETLPGQLRPGLSVLLLLLFMTPGLRFSVNYVPRPEVTRWMDSLALELREAAEQTETTDAVVWSWWDWGYYLQWRTGLRTLFDGGSQSAGNSFVAAWPLAEDKDLAAARWMRFFAHHGPGMYRWLSRRLNGEEQARALLQGAMRQPARLEKLAADARFSRVDLEGFFYPQSRGWVYLPVEFLGLSRHWLPLAGEVGSPNRPEFAHLDYFLDKGFSLQRKDGRLYGVTGPEARDKGLPPQLPGLDLDASRLPEAMPRTAGQTLLLSGNSPLAYVADGPGARSLGFRLLAPANPRPAGFAPLVWRPGIGGVWRVLPADQN